MSSAEAGFEQVVDITSAICEGKLIKLLLKIGYEIIECGETVVKRFRRVRREVLDIAIQKVEDVTVSFQLLRDRVMNQGGELDQVMCFKVN